MRTVLPDDLRCELLRYIVEVLAVHDAAHELIRWVASSFMKVPPYIAISWEVRCVKISPYRRVMTLQDFGT